MYLVHLRAWRTRAFLSQEELARRAGVDRATIRHAEQGRSLRPSSIQRIARALKVNPEKLRQPPPD